MSVREAFINSHVDTCLEKAGGVAAVAPPPTSSKLRQHQQQGRPSAGAAAAAAAAAGTKVGSGSTGGGLVASSGGGAVNGFSRLRKGARGAPLDAPPKLCFELLKDRELKGKLTALGLSNEGNKKVGTRKLVHSTSACADGIS